MSKGQTAFSLSNILRPPFKTYPGGGHHCGSSAAHSGNRQCRRLHDGDRAQERQRRFFRAAKRLNRIVNDAKSQSAVQTIFTPFRASVPQILATVDRTKAETLGVTVGQVFQALESYLGSTYVGQINKFGHVFQVYVQSQSQYRSQPRDIAQYKIRTPNGGMVPLGTLVQLRRTEGPSVITLYNLYPAATINRHIITAIQLRTNHGAAGTNCCQVAAAWHWL